MAFRMVSVGLVALVAFGAGGVATASARTVGEFIDDARIAGEITARLTADSPSNLVKVNVKSESGIVTLDGTVDSEDKRARAAQIASSVDGVKGLVNNIHVAGTPSSSTGSTTPPLDATGTISSVDPSTGTITLSDGRVLRTNDRTTVYLPADVHALKPGDHVLVRGGSPITARAPEMRLGTVARVDAAHDELMLTDGTVVHVLSSALVHRGNDRVSLAQVEPGAEVVIQLAPVPSASPGTTRSPGKTAPSTTTSSNTTTTPRTTTPVPARTGSAALDAADVNVVWTPSTATR
jgi:hypothetical protein